MSRIPSTAFVRGTEDGEWRSYVGDIAALVHESCSPAEPSSRVWPS